MNELKFIKGGTTKVEIPASIKTVRIEDKYIASDGKEFVGDYYLQKARNYQNDLNFKAKWEPITVPHYVSTLLGYDERYEVFTWLVVVNSLEQWSELYKDFGATYPFELDIPKLSNEVFPKNIILNHTLDDSGDYDFSAISIAEVDILINRLAEQVQKAKNFLTNPNFGL